MRLANFLTSIFLTVLALGCSPNSSTNAPATATHEGHDHAEQADEHAHPGSLAEAVDAIEQSGKTILDAFKNGKPEDSHDKLHGIGHLIESLPALGIKSNLTPEAASTVAKATEALMDTFGALDESLHGGEAKNIDEISKAVETSLSELKAVLPKD